MNKPWRSLAVFGGLSAFFAAILVVVAKPLPHVETALPFAAVSHNIPYFLYLRLAQWAGGLQPSVVMTANGLLALIVCALIFWVAYRIAEPKHQLLRGLMAMLMFELNPLVIILPLTLGFLGGYLLVPLFLLIFLSVMLSVDHWSAFMRAIVLSATWSLFLWVHLPAAIIVLVAMIPWVLYNRRPSIAAGTFVTIILLGTAMFSLLWTAGCLIAQRSSMLHDPLNTLQSMSDYLRLGITTAGTEGPGIFKDRLVHMIGWLSPFLSILGIGISAKALIHMFRQRRTGSVDLVALISLVVLGVTLLSPGKDTLPGAWYLIMVAAMWSPLVARELANKEHLFTRPTRILFSMGFVASCAIVWVVRRDMTGALLPDGGTLLTITASVLAIGALLHVLLKNHPLPLENRVQAYLLGSTLGYFVVMDFWLLK